jgi:hypothetical protein
MAEIVLRFRNRQNREATATVQAPVVIRFTTPAGLKKRVVVRDDAKINSIVLTKGFQVPPSAEGKLPPKLVVEDDVGPISPTSETTAASSPPPPPGDGPGVCYDVERQTFCW